MCLNWIIGQPFSPLVDQSVEILTLWTQEVNNKNHDQASNNTLPSLIYKHMAGSSQPQLFFAAGCLFADFVIAVKFCLVIKSL